MFRISLPIQRPGRRPGPGHRDRNEPCNAGTRVSSSSELCYSGRGVRVCGPAPSRWLGTGPESRPLALSQTRSEAETQRPDSVVFPWPRQPGASA